MNKHIEINPLDVFGLRQLDFCPPHFQIIQFDLRTNVRRIENWIYENLAGRFYIGNYVFVDEENHSKGTQMQKIVAFELHEEASYFGLFLPILNKSDYNDPF